ncbi:MAG: hypothetical protein M1829_006518 [Trizodia sp. TS-e1964]|nr:MAG: hypothetical protein M1829_006518 [Trizodia sp. TS-e1964]
MSVTDALPPTRPRGKSSLSLRSNGSKREKLHTRRISGKADPTLAISEAEPSAVASDKSNMDSSIRNIQHRDAFGNIIADPDRSNPTRSRWERPLDTIRSFEAAIDGRSRNRSFVPRNESSDALNGYNRRSAYSHNQGGHHNSNMRYGHTGFDGRPGSSRPDSYADYHQRTPNPYSQHRGLQQQYAQRMNYESQSSNNYHNNINNRDPQAVYAAPILQQSYDTVTSGAGSGGSHVTDQWGNSTDPSSENSSIDRNRLPPKPDLGETYGFSGFGGAPNLQTPKYVFGEDESTGQQADRQASQITSNGRYYMAGANNAAPADAPPLPPKHNNFPIARKPINLNQQSLPSPSTGTRVNPVDQRPVAPDKRKSWFKRFSKG